MAPWSVRTDAAQLPAGAAQPGRTSRKLSGIQSSRRSGTPSMSVIQSADVTEPRMATTTLLLSWSRTTMYGSAPSAWQEFEQILKTTSATTWAVWSLTAEPV